MALAELISATVLIWYANRSAGIAPERRTHDIGILVPVRPTVMTVHGDRIGRVATVRGAGRHWHHDQQLLLFVGTFGFEMFRMLPFTFDGTVKTFKDGVFIVDEHQRLLYSNPAFPL